MTREYTCCSGDYISCPKCQASGGPDGATRAKGVMTDREYKDRRCNACGHMWTVGDTLDLPLGEPEKPAKAAEDEGGTKPPLYDFGDGFEEEQEGIPF